MREEKLFYSGLVLIQIAHDERLVADEKMSYLFEVGVVESNRLCGWCGRSTGPVISKGGPEDELTGVA